MLKPIIGQCYRARNNYTVYEPSSVNHWASIGVNNRVDFSNISSCSLQRGTIFLISDYSDTERYKCWTILYNNVHKLFVLNKFDANNGNPWDYMELIC